LHEAIDANDLTLGEGLLRRGFLALGAGGGDRGLQLGLVGRGRQQVGFGARDVGVCGGDVGFGTGQGGAVLVGVEPRDDVALLTTEPSRTASSTMRPGTSELSAARLAATM